MDSEEPFKRGYLFTPPQGKLLKRSWQKKKYYALYQASNLGVERVEIFDSEAQFTRHQSPNKLIPLNDCIKVVQAPQKNQSNVFEVICKNQIHQFSAETTQELAEWIASFQTVAFGFQRRESHPVIQAASNHQIKECDRLQEENLIYSSMSKPEIYLVQIVESEASKRCNLTGTYQFVVTPLHISISPITNSSKPSKPLYTWHYRHIRRFSQTKETFSFEAGRKCASGEGVFKLETKEGNAIFQSVGVYLKSYKKQGTSASTTTASDKTSTTTASDKTSTTNTMSSSSSSSDNQSQSKSTAQLTEESLYENTLPGANLRPPIIKPPRKMPSTSSGPKSTSDNTLEGASRESLVESLESIAVTESNDSVFDDCKIQGAAINPELLYDVPEERTEAWKTHALEADNIHIENIPSTENSGPLYASVDVTTLPTVKIPLLKRFMSVPEALLEGKETPFVQGVFGSRCRDDGDSYDHLFGRQHSAVDPTHIYKKLSISKGVGSVEKGGDAEESEVLDGKDIDRIVQDNHVYSVVNKGGKNK